MPTDFFLSYRTRCRDEVAPLLRALSSLGCSIWRDEDRIDEGDSISEGVRQGLSETKAMIVWVSEDHHQSPICLIELRAAWIAAQKFGKPEERVFFVLPKGVDVRHLPPVRPDADIRYFAGAKEEEGWKEVAETLRNALQGGAEKKPLGAVAGEAPNWKTTRMSSSNRFVGRQKELWALHGSLSRGEMVAITAAHRASPTQLRGFGGVGKTLLCLEYANLFSAFYTGGIYFFRASSVESELDQLAQRQGIFGGTIQERQERFRQSLHLRSEPYLWILDDVPFDWKLSMVESWLAPTGLGRSLLTTRSQRWESLGSLLELSVLEPDEALRLLLFRRNGKPVESIENARKICEKIGYHPLALDVLGALQEILHRPESQWLKDLDNPTDDVLELADQLQEDLPTECSNRVAVVLQRSLDSLKRTQSWDLLLLLAQLSEAPLPVEFAERVLGAGFLGAKAELLAHSLIAEGLTLHPLLRRVLLRMRLEQRQRVGENALQAMVECFSSVDQEDVRTQGSVLPLLEHAWELGRSREEEKGARLLGGMANVARTQGRYTEARRAEERALEVLGRVVGKENMETLNVLHNLAVTLLALGDLSGARVCYEQVLEAKSLLLAQEHPDILFTRSNLAYILRAQGALSDAHALFMQVLEAQSRLLGSEHPHTLNTLHNLAVTLQEQGKLSDARVRFEQVLEVQACILGREHPTTLRTLLNLANTLSKQGRFPEAGARYEQVLDVQKRILGSEHPDTLLTLSNLTTNLMKQGEFLGACARYEQILETQIRVLGHEHPSTIDTRSNLAVNLALQNHPDARLCFEQVLEAQTRTLGPEHPDTLATLNNLATNLMDQGEFFSSRARYEQMFEVQARIIGPEHPTALITLTNIANVYYLQSDLSGACTRYQQVLEAQIRVLGPEHPDTLNTRSMLANALASNPGARSRFKQVLKEQTRILGPEHPDTLRTLHSLATILLNQGDLATARPLYEQALNAQSRILGPEHPDTTTIRYNLVLTLLQLEPAAAIPHLQILSRLQSRPVEQLRMAERKIVETLPELMQQAGAQS